MAYFYAIYFAPDRLHGLHGISLYIFNGIIFTLQEIIKSVFEISVI